MYIHICCIAFLTSLLVRATPRAPVAGALEPLRVRLTARQDYAKKAVCGEILLLLLLIIMIMIMIITLLLLLLLLLLHFFYYHYYYYYCY